MTITKFTKAFLYIAYVLAIVFTVMFFMGLDGTSDRSAQNIAAAGPYLSFAYVLAFLALGLVLVFSVINVIIDPSNLKMALVGIGGLVVIAVISYMLPPPPNNPMIPPPIAPIAVPTPGIADPIAAPVAAPLYRDWETDRKSTRLNSSHRSLSRMPSSA